MAREEAYRCDLCGKREPGGDGDYLPPWGWHRVESSRAGNHATTIVTVDMCEGCAKSKTVAEVFDAGGRYPRIGWRVE